MNPDQPRIGGECKLPRNFRESRKISGKFFGKFFYCRSRPEARGCKWAFNLGSYNYLGFGDTDSPCIEPVVETMHQFGSSTASTRMALGWEKSRNFFKRILSVSFIFKKKFFVHFSTANTLTLLRAEKEIANFVGKEEALIVGTGFATNSTAIPALLVCHCQ